MEESATSQAVETPTTDQVIGSQDTGTDQATGTDESSVSDSEVTTTEESFTDPSKLPPELQATYKSMQADYTRKTQGLADVSKKAEALDVLMNNPQFNAFMKALEEGNQPKRETGEIDTSQMSGEELISKLVENPSMLRSLIQQEAKTLVDPIAESYYADKAGAEIQRLRSAYPDFQNYESDIVSMIESGEVNSPEAGYKILSWANVKQQGINEGIKTVEKRSGSTQPPSSNAPTSPTGKYGSVLEAFEAAKQLTGWKG